MFHFLKSDMKTHSAVIDLKKSESKDCSCESKQVLWIIWQAAQVRQIEILGAKEKILTIKLYIKVHDCLYDISVCTCIDTFRRNCASGAKNCCCFAELTVNPSEAAHTRRWIIIITITKQSRHSDFYDRYPCTKQNCKREPPSSPPAPQYHHHYCLAITIITTITIPIDNTTILISLAF